MTTLDDELAKIRARANELWDEDRKARTERYIAEIEKTTSANALGIGERAPDFELVVAGSEGRGTVRLSDAVARGPVAVSFYRGQW
jgi:hypothetical protein